MSIFVIGINHKTAPLAIREKVYFSQDKLALYLQDLLHHGHAREALLLSTCNRSELYCEADDLQTMCDWFYAQAQLKQDILQPMVYTFQDEEAIAHMMKVAAGLDSMVLGEPEILGQMKVAFSESVAAGAIDVVFHRLFKQVFAVAKTIRTTTAIQACPVSIASAAVHFAKQQCGSYTNAHLVILGAGDTATLLLRYLHAHTKKSLSIVSRDPHKTSLLMDVNACSIVGFDQLFSVLSQADFVFSATSSAVPIVNYDLVNHVMQMRRARPLTLIDIAVPRDIESKVCDIPGIFLYCIDDLKLIIEKNLQGREHAAHKAEEMIQQKCFTLLSELRSIDKVSYMIRTYRQQIEAICREELLKAKKQLHQGVEPNQVLDYFAHALTQKLLHTPSVQLRQAGAEGRLDLLSVAKQLFAIPDWKGERL